MTILTEFDLDETGKIDLGEIYNQPDPRSYYQSLVRLNYRIPAAAAPLFRRVISALRNTREDRSVTALDVGCSYGVNAAILKHGYDLVELFRLYGVRETADLSRNALLARDRALFRKQTGDQDLTMIGLDSAAKAVAYAGQAGILDEGLAIDLEAHEVDNEEAERLEPVDLVISTGAIGYVGERTFTHILDRATRKPWFALFALRMFPIDEIATTLKKHGYRIAKLKGETFRQRQFAGSDEASEVLARLKGLDIDPTGFESEGWYHAEFFFAQPDGDEPLSLPNLEAI